jgi:hypothetical protein
MAAQLQIAVGAGTGGGQVLQRCPAGVAACSAAAAAASFHYKQFHGWHLVHDCDASLQVKSSQAVFAATTAERTVGVVRFLLNVLLPWPCCCCYCCCCCRSC